MHRNTGSITQNIHRRCFHAPHTTAVAPATCSEGNAAPRTLPKCSMKFIVAVIGPPHSGAFHEPASANHGLSTGKQIAITYPIEYPTIEYVITDQYACQFRR